MLHLTKQKKKFIFNIFVSSAPFLYLLKTSENHRVFWCFQGERKDAMGTNGLKIYLANIYKTIFLLKSGNTMKIRTTVEEPFWFWKINIPVTIPLQVCWCQLPKKLTVLCKNEYEIFQKNGKQTLHVIFAFCI